MHLALAAAHVQQHDERDQRKCQAQQAFADKRRQQFLQHSRAVEQPAQLPVASAQGGDQYAFIQFVRGQGAGPLGRHAAVPADDAVVEAVLDGPRGALALAVLTGEVGQVVGRKAQDPVHPGATAGLVQQ